MNRRTCLHTLATGALLTFMPWAAAGKAVTPAVPILMFHKVDDAPRTPEDISSDQLAALFGHLWESGFAPVNMSDIMHSRLDRVVQKGRKPIGITADDAHRSVVHAQPDVTHPEQRNARSFLALLRDSVQPYALRPRASLFLSAVGDDRYSTEPEGYFGNHVPLAHVFDELAAMPHVEMGFHTVEHKNMKGLGATETASIIQQQYDEFDRLGVRDRVVRILAYPYGVRPAAAGIAQLRRMGFLGAVLAFPGVNEGTTTTVPVCMYNGRIMTDPFLIPRVCVGAHTYGPRLAKGPYQPIDPLADFRKDVLQAMPNLYVSRGTP